MQSELLPKVLILTPVKNAAPHINRYVELIERLDWPRSQLSIGILESDSTDATPSGLHEVLPRLEARAQSVTTIKKDFGFQMPAGVPRWAPAFQLARRATLARSRNHLLFGALAREDWVLWIDVDVVDYPADTIHRLLGERRDILQPHCVVTPAGPTFDRNAWASGGTQTLHDLRGSHGAVRLDSVGGCMLLVRADLHRDGLIFPSFRYGVENDAIRKPHPFWEAGEIETEGLAMMARDMGHQCWGLPDFEILHAPK
ncbi:MAG: ANP1/MMN9/VAN1 family protein [Xanthobacteraceae bacterium]|nr:ANP1/MMN9/VAN1 family protein [Xanthobacteraceae bacterium]